MRQLKLFLVISMFGAGAAFAGKDMVEQKPEQVPAEAEQYAALEEGEVIYSSGALDTNADGS